MDSDNTKYDGLFMTAMQQIKDINGFFDAVYGFLRRNSDFFADKAMAEKVITENCARHFVIFTNEQQEKAKKEAEKKARDEQRKKEREAAELAKQQQQKPSQQQPKPEQEPKLEIQKEPIKLESPAQKIEVEKPVEKPAEKTEKQVEDNNEKNDDKDKDKEKKEDEEKPPVGNGGRTDKYIWTQTLEEVQLFVPVPPNTVAKSLIVNIEATSLLVQIKGSPEPLIKGELFEKIQSDDSIWTLTDGEIQDYKGKYIHIQIEKFTGQMHWWSSVIKGHPTINTQKISPEPSKLDELDLETRGTVEKMMFDMRQKQMGLPSSDELLKKEKLSSFMKAHPEMDFSKCKFN